MSNLKINPRLALLLIFMAVVAALRIPSAAQLLPWSNFTPIGAMALFGGSYFNRNWKAFAFPLLTLFASDIIINVFVYNGKYGVMYDSWYWIYAAFCVIVLCGKWLLKKVTVSNFILSAIVSTLLYWLIVDGAVWLRGGTDIRTMTPLSRDFAGLAQCYLQGVPYMKNFLLGTLAYGGIMFGAFEWMQQHKSIFNTDVQA